MVEFRTSALRSWRGGGTIRAEMAGDSLDAVPVVTAFLYRRGRVLLLRRSARVGTYPGRWAGVSGYVERPPIAQARRELREEVEVGPGDGSLRGIGLPLRVKDPGVHRPWLVFTFLFRLREGAEISTDWETAETAWVKPEEVGERETVPGLAAGLARVWPPWGSEAFWREMEGVAADTFAGATELALRGLRAVARLRGEARARGLRAFAALRPSMGIFPHLAARAVCDGEKIRELTREVERATAESAQRAARALSGCGRVLTHSASRACREALLLCKDSVAEVVVTESRPKREGVALARDLAGAGLRVGLIGDAAMGLYVPRCDAVLVGADAIADGDMVVNKVGTRLAALAAREAGVPCYGVAQTHKICPRGWPVALGMQEPSELARARGVRVANVAFDATPLSWFTEVVTERGRLTAGLMRRVRRELARGSLLP